MQLEIKVALNFIISYLYNKLPRRRADLFGEELERLLKQKYEGHWYPEKPLKGSGFRCVHIGEMVDPVVELAAKRSGLAVEDVRANVPEELSVWIDPFEVSYQIGEKGAVKVLYLDGSEGCGAPELDKEIKSSFNPDAQVFVPIGSRDSSLASSPSPSFGQSPSPTFIPRSAQPITFTTASFAATKFGSTKMKKGGGASGGASGQQPAQQQPRVARSPTSSLLKHKGLSLSMHSLNFITASPAPQSQLSPNAKEFVYSGSGSPSLFFDGADGQGSGTPAPFGGSGAGTCTSNSFDVAQVFGGGTNSLFLEKTPFVEGLSYNLNTMQYPSQPFQPVVLAN
ncbi:protein Tob2 [Tupaia chinensis]|uniref:Protein Tob2 n=1 Tax=Tupaia chinensis TaxID=246437 RepID=L9KTC9_TUPCH|nr:protein Tob2 [Tupaia chinensis]XP_006150796.1 protein Tob2 [Tupaia chinensis]ELW64437.1 Protein Tob2 [Tupaia chinensis]